MKQVTVSLVLCTFLVSSFGQEVLQSQKLERSLKAHSVSQRAPVRGDKSGNSTSNKGGNADGDVNQNQTVGSVNVNHTERLQSQLDRSLKIIQTQARAFYQGLKSDKSGNKSEDQDKGGNSSVSERGSADGDINQSQTVGSVNAEDSGVKIAQQGNKSGSVNANDKKERLPGQQLDRSVKIIQSPGKPLFPAQEKSDKNQSESADGDINQNQIVGSVNVNHADTNNAGGSSTTQNAEDYDVKIGQKGTDSVNATDKELLQSDQPTRSARIARSPKLGHPHAKSHKKERDNSNNGDQDCDVDQEQNVGGVNTDTYNDNDDNEDPGFYFGLSIGDDDPNTRGHYKKDRHHYHHGSKKHAGPQQVKKISRHGEKRNKA